MKSPNPSMNSPRLFRSIRHLCAGAGTLAMLMATGLAADAPAVSLLPNGGFEKDADHDQWPDNWPRLKDNSGWIEESGNHFLRLTSTEPGKMVLLFQQARIPENVRALELSFRMRVSDLKRGKQSWFDARIMMDFKDASGAKLGGAPAPNTGKSTDGWVEKSVSFLVPENARTLDFMPTLFQVESGTFDFDDVVLKPIDPTPLQAAAAAKAEAARKTWAVAEAPQRDKWPQELHVEGRQILTKDGKEIWLQGVNVVSLEWSNQRRAGAEVGEGRDRGLEIEHHPPAGERGILGGQGRGRRRRRVSRAGRCRGRSDGKSRRLSAARPASLQGAAAGARGLLERCGGALQGPSSGHLRPFQ